MSRQCELYRHFDKDGQLLYVGISFETFQRLMGHRVESDWFDQISRIEIERFPSRKAALLAEVKAISVEKPLFNIKVDGKPWRRDRPEYREKALLCEKAAKLGIPLRKHACLKAMRHTMDAIEHGDFEAAKNSTAWGWEMERKFRRTQFNPA